MFRIKARRVIDIGGRYDVHDPAGQPIGVLEHQFGKSLLRTTWRILSPADEELAVAHERNQLLAILRRVVDFAPDGEFVPIPYDFLIHSGDHEKRIDRRLGIALGIGFDALQNR